MVASTYSIGYRVYGLGLMSSKSGLQSLPKDSDEGLQSDWKAVHIGAGPILCNGFVSRLVGSMCSHLHFLYKPGETRGRINTSLDSDEKHDILQLLCPLPLGSPVTP